MLILSRREGERIIIGTPPNVITIQVCELNGHRVRLAIDADRSIPVYRSELLEERTDVE